MSVYQLSKRICGSTKYVIALFFITVISLLPMLLQLLQDYNGYDFFIRTAFENSFLQNLNTRHFMMVISIAGPLVAAFICSDSYSNDCETNTTPFIFTRTKKSKYFRNNLVAIFISSNLLFLIPLIVNLLISFFVYPMYNALDNMYANPAFIISYDNTIYSILETFYPLLFCLLHIAILTITFSLFSLLSYVISMVISKNKHLCCALSFGVYVIYNMLLLQLNMEKYSFFNYIDPYSPKEGLIILLVIFICFLITILSIYIIGKNRVIK